MECWTSHVVKCIIMLYNVFVPITVQCNVEAVAVAASPTKRAMLLCPLGEEVHA